VSPAAHRHLDVVLARECFTAAITASRWSIMRLKTARAAS
jgi:hypothetical protein